MLHRSELARPTQAVYEQAIQEYLRFCTCNSQSVAVESARGFMSDAIRRALATQPQEWQNGLNWFARILTYFPYLLRASDPKEYRSAGVRNRCRGIGSANIH